MRWGFRLFAGLVPLLAAGAAFAAEAGPSREETLTLQKRLTDAGCYHGAIDGASSAALDTAVKACPDQAPVLRIETGMHTAIIKRIGVDAACARIATASDDKTVRLWSLPDGKLQRTIRLPIGAGNSGKVNAVAISPDGRRLAAGGWDASYEKLGSASASLVDLDSGTIRRVGTLPAVSYTIAFSADGARVAVGLLGANGIRVYDWTSGKELFADRDYAAEVYGLAFAPDGALIASSYDGQLRRYGPDLRLTAKRGGLAGKRPYGVAIDPAGRRMAVGFADEPKVSILDAATLAPIADADAGGVENGNLSKVAWSLDGGTLAAGGRAKAQSNGVWRVFLREFDQNGRRRGPDIPVSADNVFDLRPCGDGFAFAAADPAFGLVSPGGAPRTLQGPRTADMRAKIGNAFQISGDGARVRFGLGDREEKPVLFDLAAGSLADSPSAPAGLAPARVEGLPVTDWESSYEPKFKDVKIGLDDYEWSRALAVRPDRSGFALGTEWQIRAFDATGKPKWRQPGPGVAWGVDFSSNGQVLAVAYGDGTIRWLRGSDGQELLAFFVDVPTRKWVAWTPSGYYMASAGGEDLIGWHLNRGWTQEADFFPASQFRAQYNRPDIVHLVLTTLDEAKAVKQANAASQREAAPAKPTTFPPVITTLSPTEGAAVVGGWVAIDYALRSPSGLAIDRLDVLVDGQPVTASGFQATQAIEARGRVTFRRPAAAKAKVALIAYSGGLFSAPAAVDLIFPDAPTPAPSDAPTPAPSDAPTPAPSDAPAPAPSDAPAPAPSDAPAPAPTNAPSPAPPLDAQPTAVPVWNSPPDPRPKLYALLVGVTGYKDPDLDDIRFAARDAEALAEALRRLKGGLYADAQVRIVDIPTRLDLGHDYIGLPTREDVFKGLYWLSDNITDRDLGIVFLSGHGYRDLSDPKQQFWFLTQDADLHHLPTTAISGGDLFSELFKLPGKKILMVDACHSGAALIAGAKAPPSETRPNMDEFVNDFTTAGSGIVAYAASKAQELALEKEEYDRHGAFAKALIEAFGEGRGADANGRLTTDLLDLYIVERVKALTRGTQHPVWNRPDLVPDFPVALAQH